MISSLFSSYSFTVVERFLRYVQIDTQADPNSSSFPSTEKQKNLSSLLAEELRAMGVEDAHMDEHGYVYATIPSNTTKQVPVICFCSHVDTAPDCSGTGVKPLLHAYQGGSIALPDDAAQIITPEKYPYLLEHIGHEVITASGTTLLGGDDKSGVAEIMDLAHFLMTHPEVKHGTIKILFTPDEEVGRGTEKLDLKKLGADFGYTLDGGELGSLEDETFSADHVKITVDGVIAHPGYAKNTLVNALKIVGEILAELPKLEWSPETTEGRQGFVHPTTIGGIAERAYAEFIVRDFDDNLLAAHGEKLMDLAKKVVDRHPQASVSFIRKEQYRNMRKIVEQHPSIVAHAEAAIRRAGITSIREVIRGGTDGSRMSYMGLPCPNIFTGMQAIHSKHEWIGVRDMKKAVETLVHLVSIYEENA
ncbi:MAG: peptidase [Bacteroidota bacterium]|jgi:tripeptide aminopeptidase